MNQVTLSDLNNPVSSGGHRRPLDPRTALLRCSLARYQRNYAESLNSIPTTLSNSGGTTSDEQPQFTRSEIATFNAGAVWLRQQLPELSSGVVQTGIKSTTKVNSNSNAPSSQTLRKISKQEESDVLFSAMQQQDKCAHALPTAAAAVSTSSSSVAGDTTNDNRECIVEREGGGDESERVSTAEALVSSTTVPVAAGGGGLGAPPHPAPNSFNEGNISSSPTSASPVVPDRTCDSSTTALSPSPLFVVNEQLAELTALLRKRTELPASEVYTLSVEDEQKRDLYKSMWKARRRQIETDFHSERKLIEAKLSERQYQVEVAERQQFQSQHARRESEAKLHKRAVEWRKRRKETERLRELSPLVVAAVLHN